MIDLWDAETGEVLRSISWPGGAISAVCFDPRNDHLLLAVSCAAPSEAASPAAGDQVAAAAPSGRLIALDPSTGELASTLLDQAPQIEAMVMPNAADPIVVYADRSGVIRALNPDTSDVTTLDLKTSDPQSLAVSEDGRVVTCVDDNGKSRVALVGDPTRQGELPAGWTHTNFSSGGGDLIAQRRRSGIVGGDDANVRHGVFPRSWPTADIVDRLGSVDSSQMLPSPQQPTGDWTAPAFTTTFFAGSHERRPANVLHSVSSYSDYLTSALTGIPVRRADTVYAIADPYEHSADVETNHISVWPAGRQPFPVLDVDEPALTIWPGELDGRGDALSHRLVVTQVDGNVRIAPTGELMIYSPPGREFTVDLTVRYEAPSATKLAANLKITDANILPEAAVESLEKRHNTTQHFDTQSRPGYGAVRGEGEITFDLTGIAPDQEGVFRFNADTGLYDKQTWGTLFRQVHQVILVTDKQVWEQQQNEPAEASPFPGLGPASAGRSHAEAPAPAAPPPRPRVVSGSVKQAPPAPVPQPRSAPPAPVPDPVPDPTPEPVAESPASEPSPPPTPQPSGGDKPKAGPGAAQSQIDQIFDTLARTEATERRDPLGAWKKTYCRTIHELRRLSQVCRASGKELDPAEAMIDKDTSLDEIRADLRAVMVSAAVSAGRDDTLAVRRALPAAAKLLGERRESEPVSLAWAQLYRRVVVLGYVLLGDQDQSREAIEQLLPMLESAEVCTSDGELERIRPGQPLPKEPFDTIAIRVARSAGRENWLPIKRLRFLSEVQSTGDGMTDAGFSYLRWSRLLHRIEVRDAEQFTGRSLLQLRLPLLQQVDLDKLGGQFAEDGAAALTRIQSLWHLRLGRELGLSDAAWRRLTQAKQLTSLNLDRTFADPARYEALIGQLPNLERLRLKGTGVHGSVCKAVGKLERLLSLDASETLIDDSGVDALRDSPVSELVLRDTPVSADSIETFRAMPKLSELDVRKTCLGSDLLTELKGKSTLKELWISQIRTDDDELAAFKAAQPDCRVIVSSAAPEWPKDRQQREVMKRLLGRGLAIRTDAEGHATQVGWKWFDGGRAVRDSDAPLLAKLPRLQRVILGRDSTFSSSGLQVLGGATQLESLDASHMELSYGSLRFLAKCPIKRLMLFSYHQSLDDAALAGLPNWRSLEYLQIGNGTVTRPGIEELANYPNLRTVGFMECLDEAAFAYASRRLSGLENLQLIRTELTPASLSAISVWRSLREIHLHDVRLKGGSWSNLGALPVEDFTAREISDADGLAAAAVSFPNLQRIEIHESDLTDAGFAKLVNGLDKSVEIVISRCDVSPKALSDYQASRAE